MIIPGAAATFLQGICKIVYGRSACGILLFFLAISATSAVGFSPKLPDNNSRASGQTDDVLILDGKPIVREMSGGQTHSYKVYLEAGQFVHVTVDQRDFDVVARLIGPDGKLITEVDSPNGSNGVEPIYIVAETTGNYRIEVVSFEKDALPGHYEIKIVERRPVMPKDIVRVSAQKPLMRQKS